MRFRHMLLILAIVVLVLSTTAQAGGPFIEYPWTVGARAQYMFIPDGIIDSYYDSHKSISALGYGLFWGYGWDIIELHMNLENYTAFWKSGTWLLKGGDFDKDRDYIDVKGVGMASVDATAWFKVPIGDYVQYRIGLGLGVGFPYGEVKSYDIIEGEREEKPDTESLPSVLPVFALENSFVFFLHEQFSINVNFGVKNGLSSGLMFQAYF